MKRRKTWVILGVVVALVLSGVAVSRMLTIDEHPRARLAQRLGFGFSAKRADRALDAALRTNSAAVLPRVVPLLSDHDPVVRMAASELLSNSLRPGQSSGLTDEHLPALIAAYQDHRWGARTAIGLVGSEKALDFLIGEMRRDGQTADLWQNAFRAAGEPGRVRLAVVLHEPNPVDKRLRGMISELVRHEGKQANESLEAFLAVARDASCAVVNRETAVAALGHMGPGAVKVLPDLETLAAGDPTTFGEAVRVARVRMTRERTPEWFALELQTRDGSWLLHGVEDLGAVGRPLGPIVVRFLDDPDWDVRVQAARALGAIDYQEGVPALVGLLSNEDDWELVWNACLSLGLLRAEAALPEFERLAREHWCLQVRETARRAIDVVRTPVGDAEVDRRFLGKNSDDGSSADVRSGRALKVVETTAGPGELSSWRVRWISQGIEFAQYADGPEIMEWNMQPTCGVKFTGGYLLGIDEGEFGAGLLFVKDGQITKYYPTPCVVRLYRMPFGVVAITYGAMIGGATAYLAEETGGGGITVRPFKRLIGEGRTGMLPSGELYVDGAIISRDGEIRSDE